MFPIRHQCILFAAKHNANICCMVNGWIEIGVVTDIGRHMEDGILLFNKGSTKLKYKTNKKKFHSDLNLSISTEYNNSGIYSTYFSFNTLLRSSAEFSSNKLWIVDRIDFHAVGVNDINELSTSSFNGA